MSWKDILNLGAILFSPLVAVWVSMWIQDRKENRQHKMVIFTALVSTRHLVVAEEAVRALNMIDVVFSRDREVRRIWHEYYQMVTNEGLNNPNGWEEWKKKKLQLIVAMAKCLGYGKEIDFLDLSRTYYPNGLGRMLDRNDEIASEFLRVLKSGLPIIQVAPPPERKVHAS